MLLQRFDAIERLAGLSTVPVIEQFRLMKDAPFVDEAERARAQGAFKDHAVIESKPVRRRTSRENGAENGRCSTWR